MTGHVSVPGLPYARTVSGLINAGRSDGNNIQRPFLPLLGVRVLAPLMEELLPLSLIDERDAAIHIAE